MRPNFLSRLINIIKISWAITGLTLLCFIFFEGVCAITYYGFIGDAPPPWVYKFIGGYQKKDRAWARELYQELAASKSSSDGGLEWRSYNYWRKKPFNGRYLHVDQNRIRRTTFGAPKSEGNRKPINIFMFGGSTMWGAGMKDEYTIPSLVGQDLADLGITAKITNYGQTGYVNNQEVIELLLQLQKQNTPDMVVFYDGVNDTFAAFQNGKTAGIPQNEFNRVAEFRLSDKCQELGYFFVRNIVKKLSSYKLYCKIRDKFSKKQDFSSSKGKAHYNELATDVYNVYTKNMEVVSDIGKNKFTSLFYWQPTIYCKRFLTPYEKKELAAARDAKEFSDLTYKMMRDRPPQLPNSHFFDISDIFKDNNEQLFLDFCHINVDGNKIVAQRMANDIAKIIKEK